jgi:hypothetical protein
MTNTREKSDMDMFVEKTALEKVVDSPPSESEGIVKDWDGEEAAVKRK